MRSRFLREASIRWKCAATLKRAAYLIITVAACLLAFLVVRSTWLGRSALLNLLAYLIFIYLLQFSWVRFISDSSQREHLFIALGLSAAFLRYLPIFVPPEPYLDVLTITTFYCFAYSQAMVLQESRRLRLALNGVFLGSLVFLALMLAQYWAYLHLDPSLLSFSKEQIETQIGPVWFLSSVGLLILFLLDFHIRATFEVENFAIRLRLGLLITAWLLFLAFFLYDEGSQFGWFPFDRRLGDVIIDVTSVCIALGLAMPRWVEEFFVGLTFLDRRTSREVTLFVLSKVVRRSTGAPLTELAMTVADRLGLGRRDRKLVFLTCELLEADYLGSQGANVGETPWEELSVSSISENRRLAAEQQLVFEAWRLKRSIELGAPGSSLPARLIAAARDHLLGHDLAIMGHDLLVADEIRRAAFELDVPSPAPCLYGPAQ